MVFNITRRYPRAYIHRHKYHTRPDGFGQEGPAEMHYLLNKLDEHVNGKSVLQSSFEVMDSWQ